MIRILIVEDNKFVAHNLEKLLKQSGKYAIVGICGTLKEARLLITEKQLDLLLLDIELEDGNAFDLLTSLDRITFRIIFITGYDQFAINAIKYGALDYLVKPIDEDELWVALQKANEYFHSHPDISDHIAIRSW